MKELSTENKTELYDNLIERLKDFQFDYRFSVFSDAIERYFPELKESEGDDEGIKGAIIEHLRDNNLTEWASWLEKQNPNVNKAYWRGYREGKQEILDKYTELEKQEVRKVKPKFHEGEWITNGDYIWKIVMIKSLDYILQSQGGNIVENTISHVDEQFHSFTIKDAKEGDVLASKDGEDILIFRRLDITSSFSSYYNLKGRGELGWTSTNFIPATKEQRDLLFQKMKKASYEWDNDKKKLKRIEFKKNDFIVDEEGNVYEVVDVVMYGTEYSLRRLHDNKLLRASASVIETQCHLWSIQDAKDGDVFVLNDEVFIYSHRKQMYSIAVAHCFVDSAGDFHFDGEFGHTEKGNSIRPATKEQRDLLFQKMKEVGYEWDASKKEVKKKVEQKPTEWNEEDEKNFNEAVSYIKDTALRNWLKSFKDKVVYPQNA